MKSHHWVVLNPASLATTHLGVRNATDLAGRHIAFLQCLLHQAHRPLLVVHCGFPWQETLPRGRDEPAQPGMKPGRGVQLVGGLLAASSAQ